MSALPAPPSPRGAARCPRRRSVPPSPRNAEVNEVNEVNAEARGQARCRARRVSAGHPTIASYDKMHEATSIAHNPFSETIYFRRYARFQESLFGLFWAFWGDYVCCMLTVCVQCTGTPVCYLIVHLYTRVSVTMPRAAQVEGLTPVWSS